MRTRLRSAPEAHPLRQVVLRPDGTLADVDLVTDTTVGAFQPGVDLNSELTPVGSFHPGPDPALHAQRPYHLGGMATHRAYQGSDAGSAFLRAAFEHHHERPADPHWHNVRVNVVLFSRGRSSCGKAILSSFRASAGTT